MKDVIIRNTNQAFRISEGVRENQEVGMVMDPSEITIPEWSQSHYAAHWDAVVKELASKVVLAPGWDFSTGCVLELKESRARETQYRLRLRSGIETGAR